MTFKLLISFFLVIFLSQNISAQRSITLKMAEFYSRNYPNLKDSVEKAFHIASMLLSSKELADSVNKYQFPYSNYCINCGTHKTDIPNQAITGPTILDSLFARATDSLSIDLQRKGRALGQTCPWSHATTAFYENIRSDMSKLPFSYGLAVNLCHEYMHEIGFCHIFDGERLKEHGDQPDETFYHKDIAYTIGWMAYFIATDWYTKGKSL